MPRSAMRSSTFCLNQGCLHKLAIDLCSLPNCAAIAVIDLPDANKYAAN